MTCETESDLRSWRFHTHSHVSEKRSSLFAVECHCPGVDLSNSNTKVLSQRLADFCSGINSVFLEVLSCLHLAST